MNKNIFELEEILILTFWDEQSVEFSSRELKNVLKPKNVWFFKCFKLL